MKQRESVKPLVVKYVESKITLCDLTRKITVSATPD